MRGFLTARAGADAVRSACERERLHQSSCCALATGPDARRIGRPMNCDAHAPPCQARLIARNVLFCAGSSDERPDPMPVIAARRRHDRGRRGVGVEAGAGHAVERRGIVRRRALVRRRLDLQIRRRPEQLHLAARIVGDSGVVAGDDADAHLQRQRPAGGVVRPLGRTAGILRAGPDSAARRAPRAPSPRTPGRSGRPTCRRERLAVDRRPARSAARRARRRTRGGAAARRRRPDRAAACGTT